MDLSVIEAIKTAVAANPENAELRLHLAALLSDAGQHAEALDQAAAVLMRHPSHQGALQLAADAAEKTGENARAQGYRQLLEALGWARTKNLLDGPAPVETVREIEPPPKLTEGGLDENILDRWTSERPRITLADVAGMDAVKRRLNTAFLGPLRNPEMRKLYGKSLKGGLMLYGPPGCGKTFIARAVAGDLGANFLSIGLTDVLDMYIGNSERNLHELFESARRSRPCVMFLDEVDALGRKRSLKRHDAGAGTITQLLAELDGVEFDNEGVYVLAATNHPWDVDTALRRPGRLDRMLLVLPPDLPARHAMFELNLRDRPTERLDLAWLAEKTDEFSGADVVHLCDTAAEFALEDSMDSGTARRMTMNDFKRALREVRPSTRSWFESAKNHAIYANESGIYDDLLQYLKQRRLV